MNKSFVLFAVSIALCGTCINVRADDRSDIEALYKKLEAALKNLKYDATLALEAPGFTSKGHDGKTKTGQQMAEEMKQQGKETKSVKSMVIKVTSVAVTGKTAKATTSFSYETVIIDNEGGFGPKGKTHTTSMSGSVVNDLVKTGSGWKFKTMEMKNPVMTIDGKPISMGGPPKAGGK